MKFVRGFLIGLILGLVCLWLYGCSGGLPRVPSLNVHPPSPTQVVTQAMNLPWLATASSLGITLGIVGLLFAPGPLKSIAGIVTVGCAIFLGLMLLIAAYAKWFAFGALGLVVACGIYAVVNKKWLEAEVKEHILGGKKV
jgi:hypothetical protein